MSLGGALLHNERPTKQDLTLTHLQPTPFQTIYPPSPEEQSFCSTPCHGHQLHIPYSSTGDKKDKPVTKYKVITQQLVHLTREPNLVLIQAAGEAFVLKEMFIFSLQSIEINRALEGEKYYTSQCKHTSSMGCNLP